MNSEPDDACSLYRGHLLMCDPIRVASGWQANAVIVRMSDRTTVFSNSPDGIALISREAAITYARDWAVAWIDANG